MTDRLGGGGTSDHTTTPADPASPPRPEQPGAKRQAPLPAWFPVAFVALGVLALAATVRTTGGLDRGLGDGPLSGARVLVVLPMVAVLGWLAVAFGRRRDPGFGVLSRAGTATVALISTVTVVVGLALVLFGRAAPQPLLMPDSQTQPSMSLPTIHVSPASTQPAVKHGDNSAALPLGLLFAAIALLVIAFAFLALIRAVRRPRLPGGVSAAPFTPLDEAEELAEAVEAGAQALEEVGDAREAVIACYAAMEQAVQGFGFARPLADTPEDMLRRATQKNLVPGGPAGRLTDLFREARFSRHLITEGQRDEARTALAEIADYIRDRQEENERLQAAVIVAAATASGRTPTTAQTPTTRPTAADAERGGR